MNLVILDFETKDPYIAAGVGAGWAYKLNVPTSTFKVLGAAYGVYDTDTKTWTHEVTYEQTSAELTQKLVSLLQSTDYVVMHNATYDLGCLKVLGVDIDNLKVIDTKIVGILYDNTLLSYSLEALTKKYLNVDNQKDKDILFEAAKKIDKHGINLETMTARPRVIKWAYSNMDVIQDEQPDAMAEYAKQDITSTAALLMHYIANMKAKSIPNMEYWSHFQIHLVNMRARGIAVDMKALNKAIDTLRPQADAIRAQLEVEIGIKDLTSGKQLGDALKEKGYRLPTTATGQYRTDKDTLNKYKDDALIGKLLEWKETDKLCKDFLEKIKDIQQYSCPEALEPDAKVGKVFPELNLFGAAATGRFSSSNPNIQQIPSRSDHATLCRGIFIPHHPKNRWISADFANQEGRLQIHYAHAIKADGADLMVEEFKADPNLDLHQKVADLTGVERRFAKAINLGLAYGMGSAKLSKACGFGTEWVVLRTGEKVEVADANGKYILDQYHKGAPYLKALYMEAMTRYKFNGYIKTIGGRVLRREEPRFDYKALNKLIQGSAADQCLKVFDECVKRGLTVLNLVHDEVNIEGSEEDAIILKEIMETTIQLSLPVVAELESGTSWGTCEEFKPKPKE